MEKIINRVCLEDLVQKGYRYFTCYTSQVFFFRTKEAAFNYLCSIRIRLNNLDPNIKAEAAFTKEFDIRFDRDLLKDKNINLMVS
jgi:hypothetical protein